MIVKRCGNSVVHTLARFALSLDDDLIWLEDSPLWLEDAMSFDVSSLL